MFEAACLAAAFVAGHFYGQKVLDLAKAAWAKVK